MERPAFLSGLQPLSGSALIKLEETGALRRCPPPFWQSISQHPGLRAKRVSCDTPPCHPPAFDEELGGSGSAKSEIEEALSYGVIKMNVDTDTQYAFTRPIAAHMLTNYEEVLKVDGEVGNKKKYDPRSYLKAAEEAMSQRVMEAIDDLDSGDKSLLG